MTVDVNQLTDDIIRFIEEQPMFFVGTAASEGRVNVSPKGMDSLRVTSPTRIVWLNLTGSGNETAAHVGATSRMTLMFMSMTSMPLIVRVYGTARTIHPRDADWERHIGMFPALAGSRQLFDLSIELVTSSCGSGVPVMTLAAVRADEELEPFYAAMTEQQLHDYWERKNTTSIDGYPTGIFD